MRLDEIRKRYRNEWVLVEFSKLDKDLRVKAGKVIAHAPNKDDIYKALLDTRGKNVAVEYCGKIPEDVVVMFCWFLPMRQSSHLAGYRIFPSWRTIGTIGTAETFGTGSSRGTAGTA
jgi:hypothetical protein